MGVKVSVFVSYITMLIFFIVAEIIVLSNVMQPLFKKHIGFLMNEETNFSIAASFYLVYVAGVFWFATRAGIKAESYLVAVFSGAFLGLLAFGTYEVTNLVILKDWKISLVIVDTLLEILPFNPANLRSLSVAPTLCSRICVYPTTSFS